MNCSWQSMRVPAFAFAVCALGASLGVAADELAAVKAKRDAYTFVLCYYPDALRYAIRHLDAKDKNHREFARDIAERIVSLKLYGQLPAEELKLLAAYGRSLTKCHRRLDVALAQCALGSKAGIPVMRSLLKDKTCDRLALLYMIQGAEAFDLDLKPFESALEAALDDRWEVAGLAAIALHRMGNPKGAKILVDRLKPGYEGDRPRYRALRVVADLKLKEAVPILIPMMAADKPIATGDLHHRAQVAQALATIGDRRAILFLRKVVAAPPEQHPPGLGWSALCLGEVGDTAAIPALKKAFKTDVLMDKFPVAEALLKLGSDHALPYLRDCLADEDSHKQWEASKLLIKYRLKKTAADLEQLLQREFKLPERMKKNWEEFLKKTTPEQRKKMGGWLEVIQHGGPKAYSDHFYVRRELAIALHKARRHNADRYILRLVTEADEAPRSSQELEPLLAYIAEANLRGCIPGLIQLLRTRPDPMVRMHVGRCLRSLTGLSLPPVHRRWAEAWHDR